MRCPASLQFCTRQRAQLMRQNIRETPLEETGILLTDFHPNARFRFVGTNVLLPKSQRGVCSAVRRCTALSRAGTSTSLQQQSSRKLRVFGFAAPMIAGPFRRLETVEDAPRNGSGLKLRSRS